MNTSLLLVPLCFVLKPLLGKLHPWEPLRLSSSDTSSMKLSTGPPPAPTKPTARSSTVYQHTGVGLVRLPTRLSPSSIWALVLWER